MFVIDVVDEKVNSDQIIDFNVDIFKGLYFGKFNDK